jgi:GNAT superfamily N-acetyltransferase
MIIRSINAGDANAYRSILSRTTEEDRYCRFFHIVNHFDLPDINRFVEERPDMIGFIAEQPRTPGAAMEPLGVVHAFFGGPEGAEIAIVVASDARRQGVGRALLERLLDELRRRGCGEVMALALTSNTPFGVLARSIGMHARDEHSGVATWVFRAPDFDRVVLASVEY